jgi:hypothetical protein
MITSTKTGFLEKYWVTKSKPFFGTYELLVQKLHHFLDFRANYRTELKLVGSNWFSVRFGSKT